MLNARNFCLGTPAEKLRYLASQMHHEPADDGRCHACDLCDLANELDEQKALERYRRDLKIQLAVANA